MEYLIIETGKLYHHKMRLDSVLKRPHHSRHDVLSYLKTKHHLYFLTDRIQDHQLLKFIDKILVRQGQQSASLTQASLNAPAPAPQPTHHFDYLEDDDEYPEDYEDY